MAPNDAAEARKRRKEIIQSQRLENDAAETSVTAPSTSTATLLTEPKTSEKKPPKKRKVENNTTTAAEDSDDKKTQIRYDPDIPMSKDQLAAWRREARRVRNRESAAASRQRIRNRISELEEEVDQWKAKYAHAIQRLDALESAVAVDKKKGKT